MAMGKRRREQAPMWVAATDLPASPGHPFYTKLNAILDDAGFDRFAEEECRQFYAHRSKPASSRMAFSLVNAILDDAGFDRFAEEECRQFYANRSKRSEEH